MQRGSRSRANGEVKQNAGCAFAKDFRPGDVLTASDNNNVMIKIMLHYLKQLMIYII
jgi:hypothetical protein